MIDDSVHLYRYLVLKTSWGIAINLRAQRVYSKLKPEGANVVAERIYLDVHERMLSNEEVLWLVRGLKMVAGNLAKKICDNRYVIVRIVEVEFNDCDFQAEGLADAIIRWSAEVFELDIPQAGVFFDKQAKRYVFDFSPIEMWSYLH